MVDESTAMQVAKVAVGLKGMSDYVKTAADIEREKAADAERNRKGIEVAQNEQRRLGNPVVSAPSFSGGINPSYGGGGKDLFKALYDCEAESEGDLAFATGEIIIVSKKDESGWWIGSIQGAPHRQGQFPANYVEPK
jgi:hypothetical protein